MLPLASDSVDGMTEQPEQQRRQPNIKAAGGRVFGPATMATRRAVRQALAPLAGLHRRPGGAPEDSPLVLVALSGGADSLALALAVAYEAPRAALRAGAVIVDHGLQRGSFDIAQTAAAQAREMGLDPVVIERVHIRAEAEGGPEAAARSKRYEAFARVAHDLGASSVLVAHTHDDQAEQVLLGLVRGSGLRSLAGMPVSRPLVETAGGDEQKPVSCSLLRPFLVVTENSPTRPITRSVTEAACTDQGVQYWRDPHNSDPRYARVRVRERVLPFIEAELGPGITDALVRTAQLARADADALDTIAAERVRALLAKDPDQGAQANQASEVTVSVLDLADLAAPLLQRVIRGLAREKFGVSLERVHTGAVEQLVTAWSGQGTVHVPGIAVTRRAGLLRFERQIGSPRVG